MNCCPKFKESQFTGKGKASEGTIFYYLKGNFGNLELIRYCPFCGERLPIELKEG